jgi:hypothetical protein
MTLPDNITLPPDWQNWTMDKWRFEQWSGLSDDVLHTHVGLLLLVTAALVLRRAPWHWLPWGIVFVVECANETYDMYQNKILTTENSLKASSHDFWLTLLWPTLILLLFPWFARIRQHTGTAQEQSAEG